MQQRLIEYPETAAEPKEPFSRLDEATRSLGRYQLRRARQILEQTRRNQAA